MRAQQCKDMAQEQSRTYPSLIVPPGPVTYGRAVRQELGMESCSGGWGHLGRSCWMPLCSWP